MEFQLIAPQDSEKSLLEQVMLNRGITSPAMYLHTTEAVVFDPELLDNMKRGATLLLKHIS